MSGGCSMGGFCSFCGKCGKSLKAVFDGLKVPKVAPPGVSSAEPADASSSAPDKPALDRVPKKQT